MFLQDDFGEEKNIEKSRASMVRKSISKLQSVGMGHKEQVGEAKKSFQKIEVELMSEIEFMS